MLRAMLPAGVDIAVTTDDAAPGVLADATQLQQVLINLGMNAWQAIERGIGGVRFSVATIAGDAERPPLPGHHVRIRVEDNGVGMTPETLERIFEPFFTTKEPGKGSGLGLSVVHGIVGEHGGLIRVKSTPGQGSTFDVFLPLRQPSPAAPAEIAPVLRGNGARVFYVDDEPSLLKPVLGILGLLGYQATGFSSPTVALEQLRAAPHAVDLLITDLGMPGLSGLDLARQISAVRPDLPIILASGYAPLSDAELLAAGIRGRLPKPFNLRQLSEALHAHLPALLPTGPGDSPTEEAQRSPPWQEGFDDKPRMQASFAAPRAGVQRSSGSPSMASVLRKIFRASAASCASVG
jgi:CheY-like chemotaxis protein